MGFKKLVRENEESNFYKFAFKLAKKLIFKTKKKGIFYFKDETYSVVANTHEFYIRCTGKCILS